MKVTDLTRSLLQAYRENREEARKARSDIHEHPVSTKPAQDFFGIPAEDHRPKPQNWGPR